MPIRAREVFMVDKEDTFALLHFEGLWLKSVVLSVHGCPLFVVESEKRSLVLGNVMVMMPYILQECKLLTLEVANRDTETSEIILYLLISIYVL